MYFDCLAFYINVFEVLALIPGLGHGCKNVKVKI